MQEDHAKFLVYDLGLRIVARACFKAQSDSAKLLKEFLTVFGDLFFWVGFLWSFLVMFRGGYVFGTRVLCRLNGLIR